MELQTSNIKLQNKTQIQNPKFQKNMEYDEEEIASDIRESEEIINILSSILKKSGVSKRS